MSRIEKLIKEKCPNGVEFRKLEECCNILDRKRKPVAKSARESGKYPYYGANGIQDYVSDYIFDGIFVLVGEDGSVITPNGTPVVTWAEGKIWVNNHAHIIEAIDSVDLRYMYHFLQTVYVGDLIHGNIPKLNQGDFRQIEIAVPPIEVQQEIVRVLDKFTELETELQTELEARKKQYIAISDMLFDEDVERKNIIEIADTYIGLVTTMTKHYVPEGVTLIHNSDIRENRFQFSEMTYLDQAFADRNASRKHQLKDIITVHTGDVGTSAIIEDELVGSLGFATIVTRIKDKSQFLPEYVCYYLNSADNKRNIARMIKSDRSNLNLKDFNKLMIPVFDMDTQKRLVQVLSKFHEICVDSQKGLPAEIEARHKQYEYYRDKLLTFERKVV